MSSSLLDMALRRSRTADGPPPAGTRDQALVLWRHMTIGTRACVSPCTMLPKPPTAHDVADGVVELARLQAERGIRTIAGRTLTGRGGR